MHKKTRDNRLTGLVGYMVMGMLVSCASTKPAPIRTPAMDPLAVFITSLEVEPKAMIITHRLEVNGKAPLELVVEERCVPRECQFSDGTLTRFRIFDVADPATPIAQGQPILTSHFASLTSAELDGTRPRELVVRSARYAFAEYPDHDVIKFVALKLDSDEWKPMDVGRCLNEMSAFEGEVVLFSDITQDGVSEWIAVPGLMMANENLNPFLHSRVTICDSSKDFGYEEALDVFQLAQIHKTFDRLLKQQSPDPAEVLATVLLMKTLDAKPESLDKALEILMADYEWSVKYDVPFSYVSFVDFSLRPAFGKTCSNDLECMDRRLNELVAERPLAKFVRQRLLVAALRWPERRDVSDWASSQIQWAKTSDETRELTELVTLTLPIEEAIAWAEKTAAAQLQMLLARGVPRPPLDNQPRPPLDDEAARGIGHLEGLFRMKAPHVEGVVSTSLGHPRFLAWDSRAVFGPVYEALKNDSDRLAAFLGHDVLVIGLWPLFLHHDWATTSSEVADRFLAAFALFEQFASGDPDERETVRAMIGAALAQASWRGGQKLQFDCEVADPTEALPPLVDCVVVLGKLRRAIEAEDAHTEFEIGWVLQSVSRAWVLLPSGERAWWAAAFRSADEEESLYAALSEPRQYMIRGPKFGTASRVFHDGAVIAVVESIGYFDDPMRRAKMLRVAGEIIATSGANDEQIVQLNDHVARLLGPLSSDEVKLEVLRGLNLPRLSHEVYATLHALRAAPEPQLHAYVDRILKRYSNL